MRSFRTPLLSAVSLLSCFLFASSSSFAQSATVDRAEWVKVTRQMEAAPIDAGVNHEAQIAVQEINNAPDFHVRLCTDFFSFFGTHDLAQYPYHAQVYMLYVLGAAAYQVDTGRLDMSGTTTSGLTSMLRGYSQLTHLHPEFRSRQMDELTLTAISGKLDNFVAKKGCSA